MIINVRGTNGSGKSTVVKTVMGYYNYQEIYGSCGINRPEAYKCWNTKHKCDLYVVGPYQSATGGLDAMPLSLAQIIPILDRYRQLGHVLFEGVIVSTTFGAVGQWLASHRDEAIVAYLDTPLEECLRALANRKSGHRGSMHVASKYDVILRTKVMMETARIRTEFISRENAFEKIKGWLE